jgi:hypothetical protein
MQLKANSAEPGKTVLKLNSGNSKMLLEIASGGFAPEAP